MWLPNKLEIIGGLVGVIGVLGLCLYIQDLNVHSLKQSIITNEAIYKQAQADAISLAVQTKARIEQENETKSKQADANYHDLLSKYNDSLLRYRTAQGSASAALTASLNKGPPSPNRSGGSPDVFAISLADAKICATNTARLSAAHDWALQLK